MTDQGHIVDTGRPRLVSDLVWDSELDQATDPSDQEAQTGLSAHCSMAAPPPPQEMLSLGQTLDTRLLNGGALLSSEQWGQPEQQDIDRPTCPSPLSTCLF